MDRVSLGDSRAEWSCECLDLGFRLPELGQNPFLLFWAIWLWYFVTAAAGNSNTWRETDAGGGKTGKEFCPFHLKGQPLKGFWVFTLIQILRFWVGVGGGHPVGKHYSALPQIFHEAKPGQRIQKKKKRKKKQNGKRTTTTNWVKRMAPHITKDGYPEYIKNSNK